MTPELLLLLERTALRPMTDEEREEQIRNKCERCGKGAPMDYFSDHRCGEHGFGVVLCERCSIKLGDMTDAEFAAEAALHAK